MDSALIGPLLETQEPRQSLEIGIGIDETIFRYHTVSFLMTCGY
jgi:hypothetical protein